VCSELVADAHRRQVAPGAAKALSLPAATYLRESMSRTAQLGPAVRISVTPRLDQVSRSSRSKSHRKKLGHSELHLAIMSDRFDEQVAQLTKLLSTVARTVGKPRQHLEWELGLSPGYLSKILNGNVELRVKHVLMITEALGMTPVDFFRLANPHPTARTPSQLLEAVRSAIARPAEAETEGAADFDARVQQSILRLLGVAAVPVVQEEVAPEGVETPEPAIPRAKRRASSKKSVSTPRRR
jgi:hypothetical protein